MSLHAEATVSGPRYRWNVASGPHLAVSPVAYQGYSNSVTPIRRHQRQSSALQQNTWSIFCEVQWSPPAESSVHLFPGSTIYPINLNCAQLLVPHRKTSGMLDKQELDRQPWDQLETAHARKGQNVPGCNVQQKAPAKYRAEKHAVYLHQAALASLFCNRKLASTMSCTYQWAKLFGNPWAHCELTINRHALSDSMLNKHQRNQNPNLQRIRQSFDDRRDGE